MKLFEIYKNQNQTLLEYDKDITLSKFGERIAQAAKFNYMHMSDQVLKSLGPIYNDNDFSVKVVGKILDAFEKMDPTKNKQYVMTLVRWYLGNVKKHKQLQAQYDDWRRDANLDRYGEMDYADSGYPEDYYDLEIMADEFDDFHDDFGNYVMNPENLNTFRLEDAEQIKTALERYHSMKPQLQPNERDIGRFKTFYRFEDFVDSKMDPELKQEIENELLSRPDVDVLYNGPLGTVAVPRSKEASCELGKGTKWCTAGKMNNMFDNYASQGDLMIYNEKPGNAKYQIHVTLDGVTMADSRDRNLDSEKHNEFMNEHPVLSKLIKDKQYKIHIELANKTWEPGDADRTLGYPYDNEFNNVALLIDRNREWKMGTMNFVETFYLNFFLSDPVFQTKPPTRAEIGYLDSYALQRNKPWPEMEKKILDYMTNAVNLYTKNLKFNEGPGDAITLGRLVKYFKELKDPWPELDKLDKQLKTIYLRDVINRKNWQNEIDTYSW